MDKREWFARNKLYDSASEVTEGGQRLAAGGWRRGTDRP